MSIDYNRWVSNCCGAHMDEVFESYGMNDPYGVCPRCKEPCHAELEELITSGE